MRIGRTATTAAAFLVMAAGCADRPELAPDPNLEPYTRDHTRDLPWVGVDDVRAYQLAGEALVLVDTRPSTSYGKRRIAGAVGVPPDRLDELESLPDDGWIVVYCECSDDAMAIMAAQEAIDRGVRNVAILEGGIGAWEGAGHPVESGSGS